MYNMAHLWAGGSLLSSSCGTQQGDPLGPSYFALVLRKATHLLHRECPDLDLNGWFLDDGVLIGKRESLIKALQVLGCSEFERLGLQLNLQKCELWWPSGDQQFPAFPVAARRRPPEGVSVLKVPVGTPEFVCSFLRDRAQEVKKVVDQLQELEDPHVAFTLLRACLGSCRFVYALRGTSPSQEVLMALQDVDQILRATLEQLLGESLDDQAWSQAKLGTDLGGMGVRSAVDIACPAFLGSVVTSAGLVAKMLGRESVVVPNVEFACQSVEAKVSAQKRAP